MKTKNFTQNTKGAMKHFSLFIFLFSFAFAFASCSKSDEAPIAPQSGDQTATFTIAAPATRGEASGLSRYIVEAYEGNDFATTPQRVEAATGSLTLALKKNTVYTFVFWADNGTADTAIATSGDYYDATSLQDVKVNPSAYATLATPAYALATSFNSKYFDAYNAVELRNATAQINFIDTEGLAQADNSLKVKYSSGGKLNVATGKITEIGAEISRTYTNIGAIAKDATLTTDYILAPLGEKRLLDLKVTFNTEAEKTIAAVPFQQSYKTNIKGEFSNFYSSVFTVSNEVEDYTNNPDVKFPQPQIGDFYYSDETFSNTLDAAKTCLGIVFLVSLEEGAAMIVSLDEATDKDWDAAQEWTSSTVLPSGMEPWGLPNKYVFQELYAAWNGDATITANADARTAFNAKLTAAGGMAISGNWYWSSTENNPYKAWGVNFSDGSTDLVDKTNGSRVRVVYIMFL